jgi:hypothetical protein
LALLSTCKKHVLLLLLLLLTACDDKNNALYTPSLSLLQKKDATVLQEQLMSY